MSLRSDAKVTDIPDAVLPFTGVRKVIWDQMWAQPVATLWDRADVASLTRLVVLQTTPEVYTDRGLLAETRQLEDRFLLNPYARAQQRIELVGANDDEEKGGSEVSELAEYRRRLQSG